MDLYLLYAFLQFSSMIFCSPQVHFFRPVPKECLHSALLRDIRRYIATTLMCFFRTRVAGVLHNFLFETLQVQSKYDYVMCL